ncbi:phosphatase domain-containing protein [Rhodococcoides fascians]|uniref:phosphatase domain-containing protein n=1 Tax=Rhodococcoides fascians TaxID=1828 RepID=UPI00055DA3C7|nr:AAA family ATPase [Rhodococcus fascians]
MTTVVATRGYPASGKTTWARQWVAEDPNHRARINRDDLRAGMFNIEGVGTYEQERAVTIAQHTAAKHLLGNGVSVIFDDTNLRMKYAREVASLAKQVGAEFVTQDVPTPLEECLRRDKARGDAGGRVVGETVIRDMAARFPIRSWKPIEVRPDVTVKPDVYVPDESKPLAYIVDIDGTLAKMGDRSPYDYRRVGEDELVEHVAEVIDLLPGALIVMSGREASCAQETAKWLTANGIHPERLLMRATGDIRKDSVVKAELFDRFVRRQYNVRAVWDDRDQVVEMWRSMGLPCFQVAPGAF